LTERSTGVEEKRRLILDAAVRVFARKGFHQSRVGDIAREAGVAHGLLYHYFDSKDQLLGVVVREIARSPEIHERIGELVEPVGSIRRIVERGQERGEFRADLEPGIAASIFYGGVDAMLTGWVLGTRPDGDEAIAAAEHALVEVVVGGFRATAPVG